MSGVDLHIHTTLSDSSFTPEQVVEASVRAGLEAIAITDHDSTDGIEPAIERAKGSSLEIVPGVELSTVYQSNEIHILGYLLDYRNVDLLSELNTLQLGRVERAEAMVKKLGDNGVPISFERVTEIAGEGVIARPHIARAMIEEGWVSSYEEAFARYIADEAPCYVAKRMLDYRRSLDVVRQAGGVPVLAHPKNERVVEWIPELMSHGLVGIEVWHPDHTPRFVEFLLEYTKKNRLLVTGGSDSHGIRRAKPPIGKVRLPRRILEALKEAQRRQQYSSDPP